MENQKLSLSTTKLSLGTKIGYGFGSLGEGLAYSIFQLYFIFFLTDFVGIAPAISGTIALVAVLWDAITDPIIGHLSDHSKHPKGKRRPFIAKFCLPLGIMIFLLFTDWSMFSDYGKIAYFLIVNALFWLAFTAVDIPYITLGGEITDDPDEKISLRSFATIFYYIGFIIAASGTMLLLENVAAKVGGDYLKSWSLIALLFGVVVVIAYIIAIMATKGKEKPYTGGTEVSNVNIYKSMIEAIKIKPYRNLWLFNIAFNISMVFVTSVLVFVFIYYIGLDGNQISIVFFAYVLFIVVLSPILGKLAMKIGNRKALLICMVALTLNYFAFKVLPLNEFTIYVFQILVAVGNIAYFIFSYAMVYEIGQFSSIKTGFNNDGVLFAFYQFSYKVASSIGMWLAGLTLAYYQYDPTAEITEFTLNGLRNMMTVIPGVISIVAIPFVLMYSLTPKNIEKLKGLLKAKEEGKEINMDEVKELL